MRLRHLSPQPSAKVRPHLPQIRQLFEIESCKTLDLHTNILYVSVQEALARAMPELLNQLERYVQDTLGVRIHPEPWEHGA